MRVTVLLLIIVLMNAENEGAWDGECEEGRWNCRKRNWSAILCLRIPTSQVFVEERPEKLLRAARTARNVSCTASSAPSASRSINCAYRNR